MKTLTIKLASSLQSYGDSAHFGYRTTYRQPSKSAVLGMIAAALGYRHDDPRIRDLNQLSFAVRTDQLEKQLVDFQTIDVGKRAPKLSHRYYWMDAIFIVAIAGDDAQIDHIEYALHHPKFQLYLGRKSTPPAGWLETKTHADQTPVEVLKALPWQASDWFKRRHRRDAEWRAEIHADAALLPGRPTELVKDLLGSTSLSSRYHLYRPVAAISIQLKNPAYQSAEAFGKETTQDVMTNFH